MILEDIEVIKDDVIKRLQNFYDIEWKRFYSISLNRMTEGETRDMAGNFVEKILQNIFDTINLYLPNNQKIISKVGKTDYLSKTICYRTKILVLDKIQVDRHIFSQERRIAFIENKTYLDGTYFDRALSDFKKIAQALKQHNIQPDSVKYIIFAGQNAIDTNRFANYEAEFWEETKYLAKNTNLGLETKTFFFLKGKRASNKPWYKIKHELNTDIIKKFVSYIINLV